MEKEAISETARLKGDSDRFYDPPRSGVGGNRGVGRGNMRARQREPVARLLWRHYRKPVVSVSVASWSFRPSMR